MLPKSVENIVKQKSFISGPSKYNRGVKVYF